MIRVTGVEKQSIGKAQRDSGNKSEIDYGEIDQNGSKKLNRVAPIFRVA